MRVHPAKTLWMILVSTSAFCEDLMRGCRSWSAPGRLDLAFFDEYSGFEPQY